MTLAHKRSQIQLINFTVPDCIHPNIVIWTLKSYYTRCRCWHWRLSNYIIKNKPKKTTADCVKKDQVNPKLHLRSSSAEVWIWSGSVKRWICSSESICRVLKGQPSLSQEAIERSLPAVSNLHWLESKPASPQSEAASLDHLNRKSFTYFNKLIAELAAMRWRLCSLSLLLLLILSLGTTGLAVLTPSFPFFSETPNLIESIYWKE